MPPSSTIQAATGRQWLGFGFNQHPLDRDPNGNDMPWTEDHWIRTTERIAAIAPSIVRVVAYREWFNCDHEGHHLPVGTYNWESWQMQAFYKVLNWYDTKGIQVMTGLWHSGFHDAEEPHYYGSAGLASFPQLQRDFLEHLIVTRGLKNIKYYTPTNEPKGAKTIDFDTWSKMIVNTRESFEGHKLITGKLVGADSWDAWTAQAAEHNRDDLVAYEHHKYVNEGNPFLVESELETLLKSIMAEVDHYDSGKKPLFLSESGAASVSAVDYWFKLDPRPEIAPPDYSYGLASLDYGIQVARSGQSGALAWALDGFDRQKDPGMWNISGMHGGSALRPWYYTWSLLCRHFPAGAEIYPMQPVATPHVERLRIVGAKTEVNKSARWTFAVVNNDAAKDVEVVLDIGALMQPIGFEVYRYGPDIPIDGVSLSLISENLDATAEGLHVMVPANGGIVATNRGR